VRQPNILIISFVIFLLAFLGYSLWKSDSSPFQTVSKQKQIEDMKQAEEFLQNSEAERSLPIIHEHKEEMEKKTSEGKKWLNLFVEASSDLQDEDQLVLIHQFAPEVFKTNEKGALFLADIYLKDQKAKDFDELREHWNGRERNLAAWKIVDADALLRAGKLNEAQDLLKDKKWQGSEEQARLERLALIETYSNDQLAEGYRRQRNFNKALLIWQQILPKTTDDQIWIKGLFWSRAVHPIRINTNSIFLKDDAKDFFVYLKGLKKDQFWDQTAFENIENSNKILSVYQASFWLRLLDTLQKNNTEASLALLNQNHFKNASWSPSLELNLRRVLNYKKYRSLAPQAGENSQNTVVLAQTEDTPVLFKELDRFAEQQARIKDLNIAGDFQVLLNSPEIFQIVLLSEGWNEAALALQPSNKLSPGLPDWVAVLYTNAIRQNKGEQEAVAFALKQKASPTLNILIAEMAIAQGKMDMAESTLIQMRDLNDEFGLKAAWLMSLIEMKKGLYRRAGQTIESNRKLAESLQGQEALARIAVMEGEPSVAAQIYQRIVSQSSEAKSFLARKAFQEKNWPVARQLTESLLNEYPSNKDLAANLEKIKVLEKASR
jgi:hypothetical protein